MWVLNLFHNSTFMTSPPFFPNLPPQTAAFLSSQPHFPSYYTTSNPSLSSQHVYLRRSFMQALRWASLSETHWWQKLAQICNAFLMSLNMPTCLLPKGKDNYNLENMKTWGNSNKKRSGAPSKVDSFPGRHLIVAIAFRCSKALKWIMHHIASEWQQPFLTPSIWKISAKCF